MINVANLKLYFLYPGMHTRVSTTSVNNSDDSIASLPPRVHGEQVPRGTLYNLIDIYIPPCLGILCRAWLFLTFNTRALFLTFNTFDPYFCGMHIIRYSIVYRLSFIIE